MEALQVIQETLNELIAKCKQLVRAVALPRLHSPSWHAWGAALERSLPWHIQA